MVFTNAGAQTLNICDGPYISYNKDQVTVRSVGSDSKAVMETFPLSDISKHPLTIHFSNHANWDFDITIRKQIETEPSEYSHIETIFAVSDIEGQFEVLRNLLIANQVMDSMYQWTFGKNHLVICGDLFDRGRDVTALLWLLYKLEYEAEAVGGFVHIILGNHDIMNLAGNFKYADQKYADNARLMRVSNSDLYTKNTELGRWLLSKNIIEKIEGNLCLHAGISSQILSKKMDVEAINKTCRPYYALSKNPEYLGNQGLVDFFSRNGPFWYRGYFVKPREDQSTVDQTLSFYHCDRIIVGHTISGKNIRSYYQDKVIGIDVDAHTGSAEAILIVHDKVYTTDETGELKPVTAGMLNP